MHRIYRSFGALYSNSHTFTYVTFLRRKFISKEFLEHLLNYVFKEIRCKATPYRACQSALLAWYVGRIHIGLLHIRVKVLVPFVPGLSVMLYMDLSYILKYTYYIGIPNLHAYIAT
jgi:hypothetical protein